jgi:thiosulfate/3-mercaptopyruvate sulfurtransferase
MDYANPDALVSTDWLARHLDTPDIRIVDASYYLPMQNRKAYPEYLERHIPGAVFFDIDDIADDTIDLPHMLPPPEKFASRVRRLGIGDGNRIIVYDQGGMASAARVWWTFRVFGHDDIAVLDGGLKKWLAEGRPVESGLPAPRERHFTPRINQLLVRDLDQICANLEHRREQVLDARSRGRFDATEPELWPGRRRGHVPGSLNLPSTDLLSPEGTMLPADELAARFAAAGITADKPVVTSCGSGITASLLAFALHLLGRRDVAVYDGSWAEWGRRDDLPIEP